MPGVIEVLFTPLTKHDVNNPVEILEQCMLENRQTHVLLSIIKTDQTSYQPLLGKMIRYRDVNDVSFCMTFD